MSDYYHPDMISYPLVFGYYDPPSSNYTGNNQDEGVNQLKYFSWWFLSSVFIFRPDQSSIELGIPREQFMTCITYYSLVWCELFLLTPTNIAKISCQTLTKWNFVSNDTKLDSQNIFSNRFTHFLHHQRWHAVPNLIPNLCIWTCKCKIFWKWR